MYILQFWDNYCDQKVKTEPFFPLVLAGIGGKQRARRIRNRQFILSGLSISAFHDKSISFLIIRIGEATLIIREDPLSQSLLEQVN